MPTRTKIGMGSRLGTVVGVTAVGLAGVIGVTKVVNVNDPGKVVHWEVRSTNIMKVLVTKRSSSAPAEYLVGSEREGPRLVGNRGGERPRAGYARTSGETVVPAGEVATVVVVAQIDDPQADARSDISCSLTAPDRPTIIQHNVRSVECAMTVAG